MAKNDFSKDANPSSSHNGRQREEFESIDQESREDGDKMQKKELTAIQEWAMNRTQSANRKKSSWI